MWDSWNDWRGRNKDRKNQGLFPSSQSVWEFVCVSVCVFVCVQVCKCGLLNIVGGRDILHALSPPDVRCLWVLLLSHYSCFWTLAAGSLTAITWMSVECCLAKFFLVALLRWSWVLRLRVGRQVAVVVLFGSGTGRSRGDGGAEAQAVAQGPPVLLALEPDTSRQRFLHLFSAAQENIHQLNIWTEKRGR